MSKKIENKKRSILDSLNGHLQVQAVRLMNVDLETNIFSNSSLLINDHKNYKPIVIKRNSWNKSIHSVKNSVRQPISNNQKVRKLRPYDPLYTWNRGGRLKELRIRCQARKFFYLWRNKSIGPITNIKAEQHYKQKLIKMVWKTWYDQYWIFRVEPRLYGKAILFRKGILIKSVFLAWKSWTELQNQKRFKTEIAIKYEKNFLKKKIFNNWISYVYVNRYKIKLNMTSEAQARKNALFNTFYFWKAMLKEKLDQDIKMKLARSYHSVVIMNKVFSRWVEIRPLLRQLKLNQCKASNHYGEVLQKRIFDKWIQYYNKSKLNKKEKEKCANHYNWNVAHRHLIMWKYQYTQTIIQSAIKAKTNKMAARFQMQKYFTFWKNYQKVQKIKLFQLSRAETFRNNIIMKHAWSKLTSFMILTRQKIAMKQSANLFSNRLILRRHLNIWIIRFDEKDDNNRKLEFGAARSHYRRSLFLKYLRGWSRFVLISKSTNKKLKSAYSMHEQNLLKRVMCLWKAYVSISHYKKQLSHIEQDFIKKNVIEKYWIKWRDEHYKRLSNYKLLDDFIQHKTYCRKKDIFRKWNNLTNMKMLRKQVNNKAILHYRKSLLRKYFQALQDNVDDAERKKINNNLANEIFERKLKCKFFVEWKAYCLKRHYHRNLLASRFNQITKSIKSIVFNSWKEHVKENALIRSKADHLFIEKKTKMIFRIFQSWQQYSKMRYEKKRLTCLFVSEMKSQLDKNQKEIIFEKWKRESTIVVNESLKVYKADKHFHFQCLKKHFNGWMLHQRDRNIKSRLRQQSVSFSNRLQQVRVWYIWHQALIDKQREQYYTRFALIHWAHKLQVSVFLAWVQYTVNRKKRMTLEINAMNLYKDRLRIYTLRQWIHSADFLEQWRHHHENINSKTPNVVLKAIEQWKRFTRSKSARPLGMDYLISTCASKQEPNNSNLRILPKRPMRLSKIRPQPKIPEFILGSRSKGQIENQDQIPSIYLRNEDKLSINDREAFNEPLLAPVCFENKAESSSNEIILNNSHHLEHEFLLKEISDIKDRLQHLKDSKYILRNLKNELSDYDKVLSSASLIHTDSSFYQEFSPLHYRNQLYNHIEDLSAEIARDTPQCLLLSKRFKEIMQQLQPDR